ncbi:MAG: hypothetical protein AAF488_18265 [Planctomycetota bacterium]
MNRKRRDRIENVSFLESSRFRFVIPVTTTGPVYWIDSTADDDDPHVDFEDRLRFSRYSSNDGFGEA